MALPSMAISLPSFGRLRSLGGERLPMALTPLLRSLGRPVGSVSHLQLHVWGPTPCLPWQKGSCSVILGMGDGPDECSWNAATFFCLPFSFHVCTWFRDVLLLFFRCFHVLLKSCWLNFNFQVRSPGRTWRAHNFYKMHWQGSKLDPSRRMGNSSV